MVAIIIVNYLEVLYHDIPSTMWLGLSSNVIVLYALRRYM